MACIPQTLASKYKLLNGTSLTFEEGILSFSEEILQEQDPRELFDKEILDNSVSNLNFSLRRSDLSEYPTLEQKINQGNLSDSEVAQFLIDYSLNIDEFNTHLNEYFSSLPPIQTAEDIKVEKGLFGFDISDLFEKLEFFYIDNQSFLISSNFCSTIQDATRNVINAINSIRNFSISIPDILSQIKIETIKNLIKNVINSVIEDVKSRIDDIIEGISSFVQELNYERKALAEYFKKKTKQAKSLLDNVLEQTENEGILGFIDDMIDQYKPLTSDSISLIVFRLCKFVETVHQFLLSPVTIISEDFANYKRIENSLVSRSLQESQESVNAGAVRVEDPNALRQEALRNAGVEPTRPVPVDDEPQGQVYQSPIPLERPTEPVEGPPPPSLAPQIIRPSPQTFSISEDGIPGRFFFSDDVKNMSGDLGYSEVKQKVYDGLLRALDRLSAQGFLNESLRINSAYRTPEYNRRIGGSSRSSHVSGLALDVSMRGQTNEFRRAFITVTSQEGFTGIGSYNTFIHVDMRDSGRAFWISGNISQEEQNYLLSHKRDEFRNGRQSSLFTERR